MAGVWGGEWGGGVVRWEDGGWEDGGWGLRWGIGVLIMEMEFRDIGGDFQTEILQCALSAREGRSMGYKTSSGRR